MSEMPDIIAIINGYALLEKHGNVYTGFCPFCNSVEEKLVVRPNLNEWHCFQCGAGGNADDFVTLYEGTIRSRTATAAAALQASVESRPSAGKKRVAVAADTVEDDLPLADSAAAIAAYFLRLREVSGYQAAAIVGGNMQVIATDSVDAVQLDFSRLNELFIHIIDEAHTVLGENLFAMESRVSLSAEGGVVLYSPMYFREEPVHVMVLCREKREQYLMAMQVGLLKKM